MKTTKKSKDVLKKSPKLDKKNENRQKISENGDYVIGRIPVIELLKGNRDVNKLFLQEKLSGHKIFEILSLAKEKGVQIQYVPKSKLDTLSENGVHQGVLAAVSAYQYAELDDLFKRAEERDEQPFFIILDGIEDPHNLGSIIRTADAVGAHGIIIPKRRSVGLTGIVAKTSTGAIEHVPVVRVTNLTHTIDVLKEKGVWIFATDMEGKSYHHWDVNSALAIIIGNEGKGVSRLVKQGADELLTIPMVGHVQSLNASVASGVLLYEVFRGRRLT
ncbi:MULTISPECIES: 23S rRNA (guanosine(2251)-2'-O)-methyltransferase RlmB [unclassified Granulicatella]|uniref:23S rRNA (guanosine(2251)-2'-O)-methyltransferase RlmB n=1 Tax=unclassified Granulicatella TaxID=2630493 RepID=UPI00107314FA|nr:MULTISPECIES: 23S rRNA (guanosine(2251)-2'-O)-methyltransferase RlmB [unclassified Granulicatella]MBF0780444.1 23S rRNA (guanosine(2251)-2'-O)-methyltransferase RlmB [Granulicatella sp. 19428wC4_WM01]TFU95388.1 23S rRNA (guanosine(2251)-2'-O)-methyltransferase RlmB [Granulicatella sp. WM01]